MIHSLRIVIIASLLCLISIEKHSAQNVNISNGNVFDGEPYLAINPANPKQMAVAWMGFVFNNGSGLTIRVKRSADGGITWSTPINLPHMMSTYKSADPCLAFDNNGILHATYIDYRESPDSGGVYYTRSSNGGASFSTPVKVIDAYADGAKKPIDRPWMAVDASGNNIAVSSLPPSWVSAPNRPYISISNTGGNTWKPWRYIDTTGFLVGSLIAQPMPFPAISGNTLHVVYPSYVISQNILPQFVLASSSSWGNTFSYKSIYAANTSAAQNDTAKNAYKLYADPSNSSHLALLLNAGLGSSDLDVYFLETFNGGNTWSTPLKLNDDALNNGKMQDLTWAGFNAQGGFAAVWRDRRNAPGIGYARASEIYGTYRASSSGSFIPNFKISDTIVAYQNILSQNGNDFLCTQLIQDTLHTVWGTTRDGSLDIWYSRKKAGSSTTNIQLIVSENLSMEVFPNPANEFVQIKTSDKKHIHEVKLIDLKGRQVLSEKCKAPSIQLNISSITPGVYQVIINLDGEMRKMKLLKTD
jgi:hypothetical protein